MPIQATCTLKTDTFLLQKQALAGMIHQLARHVQNLKLKADAKRYELHALAPGLFPGGDLELEADALP